MHPIARTIRATSAELGVFSAALLLLKACVAARPDAVAATRRACARQLPVFDALARREQEPQLLERLDSRLDELVHRVKRRCEHLEILVCLGMEAVLVDRLDDIRGARRLIVIPDSEAFDTERIKANFRPGFGLSRAGGIQEYTDPFSCGVIVPVFDGGEDGLLTAYPVAERILNESTHRTVADVFAVDVLGVPLHYYPGDLQRIPQAFVSCVLGEPLLARRVERRLEVYT